MNIQIINGPNLNLLGRREPEIYGSRSFEDFLKTLTERYPGHRIDCFQSNVEGELINALHAAMGSAAGVILNAGAYTHTSIAIADAVAATGIPVIEVHISNVMAREEYRRQSYIASKCVGSISGLGLEGYALAVDYLIRSAAETREA
jgi:3-dehydroquinate dehydratase-2